VTYAEKYSEKLEKDIIVNIARNIFLYVKIASKTSIEENARIAAAD